jgi:SAM-dependent methyltransferase
MTPAEAPLFHRGEQYRQHRPDYPIELFQWLAAQVPSRQRALDLGCGSGQACRKLETLFDQVWGVDISLGQLRAAPAGRSGYVAARADSLPFPAASLDLITVAQALHWFPLPAFFREAERALRDGGLLAIISYGLCTVRGLEGLVEHFHDQTLRPWWPPARWRVVSGYRNLKLPWPERHDPPAISLRRQWHWRDMAGYLDTWSALVKAREAGVDPLASFLPELQARWGEQTREVRWPLQLRCCTRPAR